MSQRPPTPAEQANAAELARKVAELREGLEKLPAERRDAFRASLETDERDGEPEEA
ncbi:MAG TPA: hypothetical protein VGK29_01840 [Paludibaculum sp.]